MRVVRSIYVTLYYRILYIFIVYYTIMYVDTYILALLDCLIAFSALSAHQIHISKHTPAACTDIQVTRSRANANA